MKYLVDANVLSELTRNNPSAKVRHWLERYEHRYAIDVITLGELCQGVLSLSPGRKRHELESWFSAFVQQITCLEWTPKIALRWAELRDNLKRHGRPMPVLDSMIAATALTHGLIIASRNSRHFEEAGVEVINPFE